MKKVVIGLSGGVDSSVAAYLLTKEYEVHGVTLRMQGDCFALKDIEDAAAVAKKLGISHEVIDCSDSFQNIKDYFAKEYLCGKTPNPCIVCNPTIKWKALLEYADQIGAEYVATGHYAYVMKLANGRYSLKTADSSKDQTYALCMLSQEQLARTVMPLGKYTKEEVRNFAREIGLEVAEKPDSMEICFIHDDNYAGYIENYTGIVKPEGKFVDTSGKVLGTHKGITHYTVGQRKGLGIAFGKPMFVKEIRSENDEVVLSDNDELFVVEAEADNLNYMGIDNLDEGRGVPDIKSLFAKIRYSHKGEKCSIISADADRIRVRFENPVRAVTPGQALVLYDENGCVMAGGIILR